MNLSNANSSNNLIVRTVKILFVFLVCAAAAEVRAQSINDELHPPKPATVKPGGTRRPTRGTRQPATPKPPVRRPAVAQPVYNPPPPPPAPVPAAPTQTPSEIIERFMNFQRSSSVTIKDWESVVKQTTAALQTKPEDKTLKTQLAIAQGELALYRSDYSNALIQFNAAQLLSPETPLPFYGIGRVYMNTKQANQAENAFERSIKYDKNFALAYKGLGDVLSAQGKTKKAQEYYKQAGRTGVAGNGSGENDDKGSNNSSGLPGGAGNSAGTAAAPESAYDHDLKIAREYTARKKWQMSLDKLLPLAQSNSTTDLYIAVGDNYYGQEAWVSALQAYRKATELNQNSALAFYKTGMVLYQTNEFQAAAQAFEKSLILDQSGAVINRAQARKWADRANDKARDLIKDR